MLKIKQIWERHLKEEWAGFYEFYISQRRDCLSGKIYSIDNSGKT